METDGSLGSVASSVYLVRSRSVRDLVLKKKKKKVAGVQGPTTLEAVPGLHMCAHPQIHMYTCPCKMHERTYRKTKAEYVNTYPATLDCQADWLKNKTLK